MKHMEIECKWDGNTPRAFSRAKKFLKQMGACVTFQKLRIQDTYADHTSGDLAVQNIALRVRNTDGKWEATYKTRTAIKNGKAMRREETMQLPRVQNAQQALACLAQKKLWHNMDMRGLVSRFVLQNKRQVCVFDYDGATLEMALDDVSVWVLGRQVKFKEIEVELKRGTAEVLEKFAQQFTQHTQLKRAKISKVKTAEALLKFWKN